MKILTIFLCNNRFVPNIVSLSTQNKWVYVRAEGAATAGVGIYGGVRREKKAPRMTPQTPGASLSVHTSRGTHNGRLHQRLHDTKTVI